MIPKDPNILIGFINLKLRDYYPSLEALCEDLDVEQEEIVSVLGKAGYRYQSENNQFL